MARMKSGMRRLSLFAPGRLTHGLRIQVLLQCRLFFRRQIQAELRAAPENVLSRFRPFMTLEIVHLALAEKAEALPQVLGEAGAAEHCLRFRAIGPEDAPPIAGREEGKA